ncbi:branched chain amino acid ABC transporter inner membrane protein [Neobacillus bataviensis LMG 21833]|uniref:Branched chain amino acid ABC transporter inner membrane protein n=1 Tax=Neobacillus bataviensis LMG 21833 TaxID=1117379 RepID=K6EDX1_9BACI|nr:branched-chain amino acid ABC transporter permease [Neobacillus bataviensis]EKN71676.1 branched chain amino acid ABC transporter inner membrane protein [Neobacillus bataviensis LMG 21833]
MSIKTQIISWVFLLVLGIIASFILPPYFGYLLGLIAVYSLASIGMNFLTGYTEQISLGNAAFFGIGAYVFGVLQSLGINSTLSIIAGAVLSGVIAFIVGFLTIRVKDIYLAVGTLALPLLFLQITKGMEITGGTGGLSILPLVEKENGSSMEVAIIIIVVSIIGFVSTLIANSFIGRAFHATRLSDHGAVARGIDVVKYKVLAFVLSAVLTSISGSLYGVVVGYITPELFQIMISVNFLIMAIVGGRGSIAGSLLGAAFVVMVPALFNVIGLAQWQQLGLGIGMGVILLLFPSGLIGILSLLWKRRRVAVNESKPVAS